VFGYMATASNTVKTPVMGAPPYQLTLEDRLRWAQIADVMAQANHYAVSHLCFTRFVFFKIECFAAGTRFSTHKAIISFVWVPHVASQQYTVKAFDLWWSCRYFTSSTITKTEFTGNKCSQICQQYWSIHIQVWRP